MTVLTLFLICFVIILFMRYKHKIYKPSKSIIESYISNDLLKNSKNIYIDPASGQIINATSLDYEFGSAESGYSVNYVDIFVTNGDSVFIFDYNAGSLVIKKSSDLTSTWSIIKTLPAGSDEPAFACEINGVILFWYGNASSTIDLAYSSNNGSTFTTIVFPFYTPIKKVECYDQVFYLERPTSVGARILNTTDGINCSLFQDDFEWWDIAELSGYLYGVAKINDSRFRLYRIYEDGTKDFIRSYNAEVKIFPLDDNRLVIGQSIDTAPSYSPNGSLLIDIYDFSTDSIRTIFEISDKDYIGIKVLGEAGGDVYFAGVTSTGPSNASDLFIVNKDELVYHYLNINTDTDIYDFQAMQIYKGKTILFQVDSATDGMELQATPIDRLSANDTETYFIPFCDVYLPIFIPDDTIIPKQIILKHDPLLGLYDDPESPCKINVFVLEDDSDLKNFSATPLFTSDVVGSIRKNYDFPKGKNLNMLWIKVQLLADDVKNFVIPTNWRLTLIYEEAGLLNAK